MFFHRLRAAFEINLRCTEQVAVLSSKVTPQRPGTGGPDKDLLVWGEEGGGEGLAKGGQKEVTILVEPSKTWPLRGHRVPPKVFLLSGPGVQASFDSCSRLQDIAQCLCPPLLLAGAEALRKQAQRPDAEPMSNLLVRAQPSAGDAEAPARC